MARQAKVTADALRTVVSESLSLAQVIVKLGLVPAGGNYKSVQNKIALYEPDIAHFTGAAWNQGVRYRAFDKYPELSELLVLGSTYQSYKLKNRLLKADLLKLACSSCGLSQWLQKLIPLELDHINGVNNDNRIENMRLLCPSCHALTATYKSKNQKRSKLIN